MNQEATQSEEVKDIVERMPNKFGRIACLFLIFIVSLIVLFGWIVKYPDVIHADLKLNAIQAPVNVVSHAPGKIRLLILSKNRAKAGTIVAYIDNPASINAVLRTESQLNKISLNPSSDTRQDYNFPNNLDLGELSEPYYKFIQSLSASLDHYNLGLFDKQQQILSKLANAQSKIVTTNKGTWT